MTVRVAGEGPLGEPLQRMWTLRADANRGPYVPILAALALIRRFRDGTGPQPGAHVCSGVLELADFLPDMARLRMEHWTGGDKGSFDSQAHPLQSSAA